MRWENPEVTEIKMDAEIGSYEIDDGDRAPNEPYGHTVAWTQIGCAPPAIPGQQDAGVPTARMQSASHGHALHGVAGA